MVSITPTPIDVSAILASAATSHAEGNDVFFNTVRSHLHGKRVRALKYTTDVQQAEQLMTEIEQMMRKRWRLQTIVLAHRIGVVKVGEVAVIAAVSAANRAEAFDACRYAIDGINTIVPIEKTELFEEGLAWVVGQHDVDVVGISV
jgi:molybdopterin synthase catalytic subunit